MAMLKIRELKVDDTDETGVQAISFVDYPAIETNFQYFAANRKFIFKVSDITKDDLDYKYKWILNSENEKNNGVCLACIEHSNRPPMTLRNWIKTALPRVPVGTVILDMVAAGAHEPYQTFCGEKCSCHLEAIDTEMSEEFAVELKIENKEKREVSGVVLKSNQLIYRHNVGNGPGYVWFSKDTIRQLHKKFGWNNNITFQHSVNKKGSVILMKSWIEETDKDTRWMVRYKVLDNKLWGHIKNGVVNGYSIEAGFR